MKKCAFESNRIPARGDAGCKALYHKECEGCAFRKTEEEAAAGRRSAALRIMSLAPEERNMIIDRYYRAKSRRMQNEEI